MGLVYATTKVYAYISSAWVELDDAGGSAPARLSWGMSGNSPLDRIADPGELRIALNNNGGIYTPGGPNATAGWKKGIPIKLVCAFEGEDYIRFRGVLKDIDIRANIKDPKAYITVVDWLDYAARHPVVNPGIQTNKRGDEVMTTITNLVEIAPQNTDFDTGVETFSTVFDTVTSHTKVWSEAAKVAFSELGFVYRRADKGTGETIVFEAQDARPGSRTVDEVPLAATESGAMLKEDDAYLLLETGGKILLNQTAATTFDSSIITDFSAPYGDHQINRMTVYAYPRRLSASPEVLFQLDEEIVIGSGQTYTLKGTWADPNGGLPINAQDVIEPVVTTDYTMYTATGGGGSAISGSVSIISWTAGTEGFTAQIKNTNAATGYLNKWSPRGTGIFQYNPIEHAATNSASIEEYETESETIHQKYQNTLYTGRVFVDSMVEEHNQPRTVLNSITFNANKSAACMMAFLNFDVGNLIYIDIDELGLTGNYYIQGIEATMNGRIITVTWIVIAALSITAGCGLTPVAVEFGGSASGDGIDFGYLPRLSPATHRAQSVSAWAYYDADESGNFHTIASTYQGDSTSGWTFHMTNVAGDQRYLVFQVRSWSGGVGNFYVDPNNFNADEWVHVVVTYDSSLVTNEPKFYINGTLQTTSVSASPSGTFVTSEGWHLIIGNKSYTGNEYACAFDGKIFDPRVYNDILSQAEVTALYNSGTPSASVGPTDSLVFQAFAVRTGDTASYIDQTLTTDTNLFDAQLKAVGTVHGAPVGRAAP